MRNAHLRRSDPHVALAAAGVVVLLTEVARVKQGSSAWVVIAAAAAALGFFASWRRQERLRLAPLLALSALLQLGWIAIDLSLGVDSVDSSVLYRLWGNAFLHGHYPDAQYPPAAVMLFAFDAFVGGGSTRVAHAFVMIPFELLTVAALWQLRTRTGAWLTALVALWPLDLFLWTFRFDLFPTALLAVGLVAALRERWVPAGLLLGIGAAAKWTPALAVVVLAVWLVAGGRWRPLRALLVAAAGSFVLIHLPFVAWSPHQALFSYRYFNGQNVTGESLWYLLLAPLGKASVPLNAFWLGAHVPHWVKPLTELVQVAALGSLCAAAFRARNSLSTAVALAALAPAVFLLLNRVFSPQYFVLIVVAWSVAGALVLQTRLEQLVLGAAIAFTTTANALVYPYTLFQHDLWRLSSATMFAVALAASAWIATRAVAAATARRTSDAPAPALA